MLRAAAGGGTGMAGVPFCNIEAAGVIVISIVPAPKCAGRLVSADPVWVSLIESRGCRGYVRRLARFLGAGDGNFWQAMYRVDGGFPSSFESAIGPAGAGGRAAGLRQPGLPPLLLGWPRIGGRGR